MHSCTSAHLKPQTAQDVITPCSSHSCLTDPNLLYRGKPSEVVPSFPLKKVPQPKGLPLSDIQSLLASKRGASCAVVVWVRSDPRKWQAMRNRGLACVPSSLREIDQAGEQGCVPDSKETLTLDRVGADEDECCRSRDEGRMSGRDCPREHHDTATCVVLAFWAGGVHVGLERSRRDLKLVVPGSTCRACLLCFPSTKVSLTSDGAGTNSGRAHQEASGTPAGCPGSLRSSQKPRVKRLASCPVWPEEGRDQASS